MLNKKLLNAYIAAQYMVESAAVKIDNENFDVDKPWEYLNVEW